MLNIKKRKHLSMMESSIKIRHPNPEDGMALNHLISQCPPLDTNSVYCNLLQCHHFARTALVAENSKGELIGSITGYTPPNQPDTLFVWQVALHPEARGQGLASTLLNSLFDRSECQALETTISPGNIASESLFERFFKARGMAVSRTTLFDHQQHFNGQHDSEVLYRGSL
jgi:L-2,4-diaminobutyric acid acetyltransferase